MSCSNDSLHPQTNEWIVDENTIDYYGDPISNNDPKLKCDGMVECIINKYISSNECRNALLQLVKNNELTTNKIIMFYYTLNIDIPDVERRIHIFLDDLDSYEKFELQSDHGKKRIIQSYKSTRMTNDDLYLMFIRFPPYNFSREMEETVMIIRINKNKTD